MKKRPLKAFHLDAGVLPGLLHFVKFLPQNIHRLLQVCPLFVLFLHFLLLGSQLSMQTCQRSIATYQKKSSEKSKRTLSINYFGVDSDSLTCNVAVFLLEV